MTSDPQEIARGLTEADVGQMFHVPWSPNPHRLEAVRLKHCQLHGEFIGLEACFRKKRNSTVRPWGSLYIISADNPEVRRILKGDNKEIDRG
jgi:hypothetical protein